MSEENKELVRRLYEAGTGDLSAMDELVTADFVDHHWLPDMQPGPESAKAWELFDSGPFIEQLKA